MNRAQLIGIVLSLFVLGGMAEIAAGTGTPALQTGPTASSSALLPDNGFDIVLLMDCSGSMKKTDPRDYRKSAAKLLVSLLAENDRIGIVSFGDSARVLAPLTMNIKDNREALFRNIDAVTSREFSTNITAAVKKAYEELRLSERSNRVVILMSDGKLALGSPDRDAAASAELKKLLPDLQGSGIKIHSIAFSEFSDMKLLADLARETNGATRIARADHDLPAIFTSIFEKIKSPDTLPFLGDTFVVDDNVQEAVLFIAKKNGIRTSITEPSGSASLAKKHAENIVWYESDIFDMITIRGPMPGTWKVHLSGMDGNKVFVITDLNLKNSPIKDFIKVNEILRIEAWIEKQGVPVQDREVLQQVQFYAEVIRPDGQTIRLDLSDKTGSEAPAIGVFKGELLADVAGDYSVKVFAEGKTFQRQKQLQFRAHEPALSAQEPEPVLDKALILAAGQEGNTTTDAWKSGLLRFLKLNLLLIIGILICFGVMKFLSKRRISPRRKDVGKSSRSNSA